MNHPSYSHVRDHGFIAKAANGTLLWLRDCGSSFDVNRELTYPSDSSRDVYAADDALDKEASAEDDILNDTWVFRDAFMAWMGSEGSECLLVTGPLGQGKSVLTISVLNYLEMTRTTSKILERCKVIYHFCSIKFENKFQTASFVLRTFIVQLCNDRRLFARLPSKFQANNKEFSSASFGGVTRHFF